MGAEAEAEIRRAIDGWAKAIRAKDVDGSLAGYAQGVLAFDLIDPLQYAGVEAVRERLEQWFSSFDGPIDFENRDLRIVAGEDVAFCHSLNHVSGTTTGGQTLDMWWRATLCLRKIDAEWFLVHSHTSVPFDMASRRA